MFRHLLLPTDGSKLAAKSVKAGVRLAKALGAKVTAVYVARPYAPVPIDGEMAMTMPGLSPQDYKRYTTRAANRALAVAEREAKGAGVRHASQIVTAQQTHLGILKAAKTRRCDAIAMASHGRGALGGLLLGSVTTRVLAQSRLPVVVFR
jgi:nucleotide-binding universal stress UspA family protein